MVVSLRDIVVEFDGQRILDGLNLDIHDKEFVTLLGSSGCGKTTTLRLIAGFLEPNSGKVLLKGQDITGVPPYKRPVNTVFQKYALFPHLNVFENVAFGLRLKKMDEETIRRKVDQETKYKRQSGGSGQYGHVKITVEPNESGKGYEFVNAVVGGAIPKEFIPAVDAGIQGALQSGVIAGFPVVDVKVTLYDGSYHEVDSSEMAFKIAGSMAFKEAMRKADPVLLEPIMKVSVIVPDEYLGTVIGDLTSRRGQIQGQEARPGAQQVDALVPLANMFGYATDLRSNTQGRGQYTMEPHSYAEIPKSIRDKIVEERGKKAD